MDVTIPVPGGEPVPAHLALAAGDGPQPGVVVLHEAFGLTADIRAIAAEFARRGFHALAPDLLSHGGRVRCLTSVMRAMRSGSGRPFAEIAAARDWLAEREDCTGRVGVAGFCLGGGFAILMAGRGFDVSAVQYGILPRRVDEAVRGACPVVASYGARDLSLRGAADRLSTALERAGVRHDVKEYPDAGHSFMNHSEPPAWMRPMTRPLRAGHVEDAADDAWDRVQALFDDVLRRPDEAVR
ncbi:MAG: dienelactone hydrolase family protein [Frankiales bacterium]|nr:dienelactone hydrolase family protein [Frankiales bacterium]